MAAIPQRWSAQGLWVASTAAVVAAFAVAGWGAEALVNWNGLPQLRQFFSASLRPDLSPEFLVIIARATAVTFAYGVCGTVLSLGLGFLGGLASAEASWQLLRPGRLGAAGCTLCRGALAVPRAIHELVWGLLLLNVLGLDPLVGVVAIALPFGAIVAKVFAEILDETDPAPLEALVASGVAPPSALLYGLLPQALPNLLSYSFYRFECSLRSAAVLGVIGAGGLGYEILLSLQSLRYAQLWTGFYALILLSGAVDAWSGFTRRRLGCASRLQLNAAPGSSSASLLAPDLLILVPVVPLCFWVLGIDWGQLVAPRSRLLLLDIVQRAIPQNVSAATLLQLGQLSLLTAAMALVAIVLAGAAGMLCSFPAAQNFWLPGGLLRPAGEPRATPLAWLGLGLSRLLLLVSRAVPAPIWALVFLFVLFPGIWPGALALAVHNFGILGRLMAEVNENVDQRPLRALSALGASAPQVVLYGLLPENLGSFLAYILYRWEVCTRETVIVGLVGAGGLGRLLTEQISSFDYGGVTLTLGAFVLLTFGVDWVSQQLRRTLR